MTPTARERTGWVFYDRANADRTGSKRRMLAGFAFVGSVATAALAFMAGTNWQVGFVLFLVANTAYGASIVVYYAFLPELAAPTNATRSRRGDGRSATSAAGWRSSGIWASTSVATRSGCPPETPCASAS